MRLFILNGIWWDDWAWVWHYFGTDSYKEFIEPFCNLRKELEGTLLYLFCKLFDIFKYKTIYIWNILKFITFITNSIIIFNILKKIFKEQLKLLALFISIFYLVSPIINNLCFVTLINQLELLSYLISFYLLVCSIIDDKIRIKYYFFSILFTIYPLFALNSFVFMEFIKLFIIFVIFFFYKKYNLLKSVKKTIMLWFINFILIILVFILYKLYPQSGVYSNLYSIHSFSIKSLIIKITTNYFNTIKYSFWLFYKSTSELFNLGFIKFQNMIFMFLIFTMVLLLFKNFEKKIIIKDIERYIKICFGTFFFSIIIIFFGFLPYAIVRTAARFGETSRHALFYNVGFSILIPTLFFYLYLNSFKYKSNLFKNIFQILFSILIILNVYECFIVLDKYDKDWQQQRELIWQLSWRIPDLKDNSFFLLKVDRDASDILEKYREYELSALINFAYAKSNNVKQVNNHYATLVYRYMDKRLSIDDITNENSIDYLTYRGFIKLNYDKMLIGIFNNNCLFLNNEINDLNSTPNILKYASKKINYNQINKNEYEKDYPLRWILGKEIKHKWTYYYQKACLYLENKEFYKIETLYYEMAGNKIKFPSRYLIPFIKGIFLTKNYELGKELLLKWWIYSNPKKRLMDNIILYVKKESKSIEEYVNIMKEINTIL
jgi:hypothetical protein